MNTLSKTHPEQNETSTQAMPQVDFHTHLSDPIDYACRLVRKAYAAQHPLLVVAEPNLLRAFDERLWVFSALEFIPHCMLDSPLASTTPVLLTSHFEQAPHYSLLLNLNPTIPPHFERFARIFEIVSTQPEALTAARERYRFYREHGCVLNNYRREG